MNIARAKIIAADLLTFYLPNNWRFGFDNAQRRFGYCRASVYFLSFSKRLTALNTEEAFIDVVLHEIAHALTPGMHHNYKWKRAALAIGCDGERCYSGEVVRPATKVIGTCPGCSKTIHRYRRARSACAVCCNKNGGRFNSAFLFIWTKP